MADRNEIRAIQNELLIRLKESRRQISRIAGVHHADVGVRYIDNRPTNELCIRLHVYHKNTREFLESKAAPEMLAGVRTDVIESQPVRDALRADEYSPQILGGLQIANPHISSVGTLGCVLRMATGELAGLTNHHVLLDDRGRIGDSVIQPFRVPTDPALVIGEVAAANKWLDSALFKLNNSREILERRVLGFPAPIQATDQPLNFDLVKKCGATTGITFGRIEGVDENGRLTIVSRTDKPNPGGKISDRGDSGSIWLLDIDEASVAIGLHFEGSASRNQAFAYDIRSVFQSLQINPLPHFQQPVLS